MAEAAVSLALNTLRVPCLNQEIKLIGSGKQEVKDMEGEVGEHQSFPQRRRRKSSS
ncbi:hypothetical protein Patl1_04560 [Pistacia atlantica]|uniref:Uncharacterized protein n=1 Tax=Pistacia atlantica TaxID=434234 RepID=A0ACC1BWC0_9ROSI|nr:hypothetical protein Patl1_04560 [Pistacia atlantica]